MVVYWAFHPSGLGVEKVMGLMVSVSEVTENTVEKRKKRKVDGIRNNFRFILLQMP